MMNNFWILAIGFLLLNEIKHRFPGYPKSQIRSPARWPVAYAGKPQSEWRGVRNFLGRRKAFGFAKSSTFVRNFHAPTERVEAYKRLDLFVSFCVKTKRKKLSSIDWVIVGGESGAKARPMKPGWALNIKRQCEEPYVAFFFKQWGAWGMDGVKRSKKSNGRLLEGQEWNEYPEIIDYL